MKISASFLSIKEDIKNKIQKLDDSNIDYIHLDIMDNIFVPNITFDFNEMNELLKDTKHMKDVHLMVFDPVKFANYLDKTFGKDQMAICKEYINHLKKMN